MSSKISIFFIFMIVCMIQSRCVPVHQRPEESAKKGYEESAKKGYEVTEKKGYEVTEKAEKVNGNNPNSLGPVLFPPTYDSSKVMNDLRKVVEDMVVKLCKNSPKN